MKNYILRVVVGSIAGVFVANAIHEFYNRTYRRIAYNVAFADGWDAARASAIWAIQTDSGDEKSLNAVKKLVKFSDTWSV